MACEFDNVTPYRDETIDKKRSRRGLMNREEADDSIAPIGEVVGWIEANLWTNYSRCRCHVLLPWIDYHYCNTLLVLLADKLMRWYGGIVRIAMIQLSYRLDNYTIARRLRSVGGTSEDEKCITYQFYIATSD